MTDPSASVLSAGMGRQRVYLRRCPAIVGLLLLLSLLLSRAAHGQEELGPILERGYVAHWLVCGPFAPDVPGGILDAIESGEAVLGGTDFMAGLGGIARARPQHLMRVERPEGGQAIWQRAGTADAELDLKPFFPASPAGVAYAAFYTVAPRATAIFLDVQSPLGVRVWVNGFPAAAYEPAPLDEAGVAQFVARLRQGNNLVVMQVPGADYAAIAQTLGITTQELTASTMANRPRLRKTSGFAISTHVRPAEAVGDLFYVPDLEDAGTFSGGRADTRQDAWLTLYNPAGAQSSAVDVIYTTPGADLPDVVEVDPIDARSAVRVPLAVPVQGLAEGAQVSVQVRLSSGGAEAAFNDTLAVRPGADAPGIVRVITGHTVHGAEDTSLPEAARARLDRFRHQILFAREADGYGFDLGYPSEWHRPYVAYPDLRADLLTAAQQGAATVRGPYAPVDERLAGGALLWRNLQIGLAMNQGILESATPHYLAWHAPGIAPQTVQLLDHTPLDGIITSVGAKGLPPLSRHRALHGDPQYLRRKLPAQGPTTAEGLREMAALQRREPLALGVPGDVLVVDSVVAPPEPFYRGSVARLARSVPRVVLDGGGGAAYFEDLAGLEPAVQESIPPAAAYLNSGQPGDLLTWPMIKAAQARAARQLEAAEALATFAGFHGGTYPHAAMDLANRQLAFYSTPGYLAAPATRNDVLDTLAGLREVAELSRETLNESLGYIAEKVDTAGAVPLNEGEFEAVVVFNPASQAATLPVQVLLPVEELDGLTLVDETGAAVPFSMQPYQGSMLLEFMADDLPSFGYRTYFYQAGTTAAKPVTRSDHQIENEYLALFVDPDTGAIARLDDKRANRRLESGLLNEIRFLEEDEAENAQGRELWTSPPAGAPPKPVRITSEHAADRETITVTTAVHGGTLERRYTLRAGQPWVHCDTRLIGVDLRGRAAFASFDLAHAGRSLVVGERLGAIMGARDQDDARLRTRAADNIGGTVSYPAHTWAAITPADAIEVGPDGVVPLEPAVLVHGPDGALEQAARDLQAALYRRGIPSILHAHPPEKPDFLWTDATTETDPNDYLRHGYRMRIVIGGPDQNAFNAALIEQLPEETVRDFAERISQGARLLLNDENVPDGLDPVPTLVLAGPTSAESASLANRLTDAVKAGRRYLLPPSAHAAGTPAAVAPGGCAVLFPGSMGVAQQHDGRLLLGLAHRAGLERDPDGARLTAMMDERRFTYALHPFEGTWREADVPGKAEAAFASVWTARTGIHPGELPARQSYLGVSDPGLRIGGIKPAGFPEATNTRKPFHPRDGITAFAWETRGEPWRGEITGARPFLEARQSDVYGATLEALDHTDNRIAYNTRGYGFQPLWLLPAATAELDGLGALGRSDTPYGPIHTRYWREHRGAAPLQKLPLGVLLRGSLAGDATQVEAVISNHLGDKSIEGTAHLSASSGISFGPREFPFSLPPGEQHVEPIQLAYTPDAGADRALAIEAGYARQTYRDVLMTNGASYAVSLSRNGAQLRAEIRNESGIHAKGTLDVIVSPRYWPEFGSYPPVTVEPRRAAINVPPHKSQTVIFTVSDPALRPVACVKLAANGTVQYQFFPRPTGAETAAPEGDTPTPPPPRNH